jgi:hypothetical protein
MERSEGHQNVQNSPGTTHIMQGFCTECKKITAKHMPREA